MNQEIYLLNLGGLNESFWHMEGEQRVQILPEIGQRNWKLEREDWRLIALQDSAQ